MKELEDGEHGCEMQSPRNGIAIAITISAATAACSMPVDGRTSHQSVIDWGMAHGFMLHLAELYWLLMDPEQEGVIVFTCVIKDNSTRFQWIAILFTLFCLLALVKSVSSKTKGNHLNMRRRLENRKGITAVKRRQGSAGRKML